MEPGRKVEVTRKESIADPCANQQQIQNEKWESIALAPVNPEDPGSDYFVISLSDNDFITQEGYLNFGRYQYADSSGYTLDTQALVFQVTMPS